MATALTDWVLDRVLRPGARFGQHYQCLLTTLYVETMTFLFIILLALSPWIVTALRLRRVRSIPVAASAAFVATGGILLFLALLGAGGMFRALERLGSDVIMLMIYAGIGMMIAAVACALLDRR